MLYTAVERNKKPIGSLDIPDDFERIYLSRKDRQMRFCNAKDPIYHIFSTIENRPLSELFKGFVKETVKDSKKFLKELIAA